MAMLSKVGEANAETHVPGTWNLVILHHTDCGMTDLAPYPDLLAEYVEIPTQQLPSLRTGLRRRHRTHRGPGRTHGTTTE
jgi:carbonic anhydrase